MKKTNFIKYFLSQKVKYKSDTKGLSSPIIFGGLVFLMLYIFRPFGITEYQGNMLIFCLIYGFITFFWLFLKKILFEIKKDDHSIAYIIFQFWIVFPISISNWFNLKIFVKTDETSFLQMLFYTVIIGIIVFSILFLSALMQYYKLQFQKLQNEIDNSKKISEPDNDIISIETENKSEKIVFNSNSLIYIKAEGNYSQFHFIENNSISKKLYRISLSNFIDRLPEQQKEKFIRCHKSYIVNNLFINSVSGNSHTPLILLNFTDTSIPVSRNLYPSLLSNSKIA